MKLKKRIFDGILMLLVATMIIVTAVTREQSFLKTLPTLVTLIVQLLLASANRYAFLLGGINATVYGLAYVSEGLYFSAASAFLVSAPLQILSFFQWGRHAANGHTELLTLRWRGRILWLLGICVSFVGCLYVLLPFLEGARYPTLDALVFVFGIAVSILSALRIVEAQYISAVSTLLQIAMWLIIVRDEPENLNYLVISFYNHYRVVQAAVRWTREYRASKIAGEDRSADLTDSA